MLAWSPPTVTNDEYDWSNTIFKFFKIPDGMNLTDCIMTIRKRAYPFELTFTNYDVLQYAIKTFSNIYLDKWNYMLRTATLNYDPLKDFSEVWTESKNGTFTRSDTNSEETNSTKSEDNSSTTSDSNTENVSSNLSTENSKTAYNSNTAQLTDKQTQTASGEMKHSGTTTKTDDNTSTLSGTRSHSLSRSDSENNKRNIDISGSTGRLTPAEMIQNERDIYLNIYNMIADDFINEFCLLIY